MTVVAFMCIQLVNAIFSTCFEHTLRKETDYNFILTIITVCYYGILIKVY